MSHTPFLSIILQRTSSDCAIACIGMLLGESYETVLLAFGSEMSHGSKTRDMHRAVRKLGRRLRWSRKFDLETDTGLLSVRSPMWPSHHLVVLKEGLIVDTDGTIWETDCYLAAYTARAMSLMTLE